MVTPQMAQQLVSAPAPPPVPLGSGQMGGGPIGGPMGGQMGVPMGGPMAPTMSFGQLPPPSSFGAAPFGLSANDLATLVQQGGLPQLLLLTFSFPAGYIPGVGQVTPQLIAQLGLQLPSSAPLAPAPSTAAIAASLPRTSRYPHSD